MGWQGRLGEPADQVALGWGLDADTVIVVAACAVSWLPDKADRRQDSVFQALGGKQVGPVPLWPRQKYRAMERARTVPDFEPAQLSADDTVCTGAVSTVHGFLVGHVRVGMRVVTFAARRLSIEQIKFRTLDCADGYTISPLDRQRHEVVDARRPAPLRQT